MARRRRRRKVVKKDYVTNLNQVDRTLRRRTNLKNARSKRPKSVFKKGKNNRIFQNINDSMSQPFIARPSSVTLQNRPPNVSPGIPSTPPGIPSHLTPGQIQAASQVKSMQVPVGQPCPNNLTPCGIWYSWSCTSYTDLFWSSFPPEWTTPIDNWTSNSGFMPFGGMMANPAEMYGGDTGCMSQHTNCCNDPASLNFPYCDMYNNLGQCISWVYPTDDHTWFNTGQGRSR